MDRASSSALSRSFEDDTRRAFETPVGTASVFELTVPENPSLHFAVAVAVEGVLPAPVRFQLRVDDLSLFDVEIRRSRPNRWHEHTVAEELAPFAGQRVRISFEAETPAGDRVEPVWGNPVLVDTSQTFERPDILLISIDCLRADHVGAYGYERDTTPRLDALAREAIVFDNAVASSSYTLPTHASMLTGLAPSLHGATARRRIAPSVAYAPENLSELGYQAEAVVSAPFLSPIYGFDRGFHTYRLMSARAERLVDEAIERLERGRGTSRFLFLHLFDAHAPYSPPREFLDAFGERPTDISTLNDELARRLPPRSEQQVAELVSLYDGEIAYVDRELGRLFDYMKAAGIYERSLIIVTADHGEAFYEHGAWEHARPWDAGPGLYQEILHVPLIVKPPGDPTDGFRVAEPVSQADVFATLASAAGDVAHGSSSLLSPEPVPGRTIVSEFVGQGSESEAKRLYALRDGAFKYLVTASGDAFLFDLANDPVERTPLDDDVRLARFQAALDAYQLAVSRADLGDNTITLTDDVREDLEALGYLERRP